MKKILLLLSVLLAGMLPFLPLPEAGNAPAWTTFLGRFHILLLHFPVVLVLLVTALELLRWRWPRLQVDKAGALVWGLAVASCMGTVAAGYLLYLSGDYQGDLVRAHLWGGVLLTLSVAAAAFFRFLPEKKENNWSVWSYRGLLAVAAGLVLYTSHQGGSLTHGPDFLSEYAPVWQKERPAPVEQKPREELLVFQDLIMPVMENRCMSCHNEYKTKGDLLLTSFAALSKGGKSGKPMLVAGKLDESELFRRIHLPADDDDHMPPPEKPALTEDEISLIRWWITAGADPEMKVGQGPEGVEGAALLDRFLPGLYASERLKLRQYLEVESLQKDLQRLGKKLDLTIEPDREAPGYFAVSLTMPPSVINDETISALLPYAEVFSKISLPGALITDDGLYELSKMTNLQRLYLPKTCIKGPGLSYLEKLPDLKDLNISYTMLDDAGALRLLRLPQLERVFLFGTETGHNVVEALQKNMPDTEVLEVEGAYF